MVDTGTSVFDTPQTDEQIQAAQKAELDMMMKINLNGGLIPQDVQQPSLSEPSPTPPTPEPTPVTFEIIKEKFNYQSPDDAIKEIEEFRKLKANPPSTPEYEFENEASKKLFMAFAKGDKKEAYKILSEQERLESLTSIDVSKETAADIIKTSMSLKNKDLTPHEIDFQYKQEYVAPKEPVQRISETDEEFAERHDEWKEKAANIEMKAIIAAKMAKTELESAKSKISFPEIESEVDPEYVQWKQLMDKQAKLDAEIQEAYKSITPKSIETKIPFIDETNKINFEFQYEPDSESFNKTVESSVDIGKFLQSFVKSDGTFDKQEYLACIHFAKNRNAILTEAIKQSKNATIKASLPDNNGGAQRQFPQSQQPNEVDEMMRLHGIKRAS